MLVDTRACRRWSGIEAVKLIKTILETAILEKTLSINVLELLFTLVGCNIWGRK